MVDRGVVADTLGRADWFLQNAQREYAKCAIALVTANLTDAATQTLEKLDAVRKETLMLQQEFEK